MVTSEMIPDDQLKSLSTVLEMPAEELELRLDDISNLETPAAVQMRTEEAGPASSVLMPREDLGVMQAQELAPRAFVEAMETTLPDARDNWNAEPPVGLDTFIELQKFGGADASAEAPRASTLAIEARQELTQHWVSQSEERLLPSFVEMPLGDSKEVQAPAVNQRPDLQVHAPIEIHIHVDGHADDSAEQLREELLSVVPQAVHNAIEQLALQMGAV